MLCKALVYARSTALFTEDQIVNETRGQWYLRQMMGSANIEGSQAMHTMTGHLSHQIEHHLFPNSPAWRYPEMAKEVRDIADKYEVPYNTGSFVAQVGSTGTTTAPNLHYEVKVNRVPQDPSRFILPDYVRN